MKKIIFGSGMVGMSVIGLMIGVYLVSDELYDLLH